MPPHWEGQAGILSTVCHVAGGEWTWTWLHPILCINPVKNTVFSHCDFSYTGHSLESCIYHMVSDTQGHETDDFGILGKKRTKTNSYIGSKIQVFRCSLGRHWGGLKDRRIQGTLILWTRKLLLIPACFAKNASYHQRLGFKLKQIGIFLCSNKGCLFVSLECLESSLLIPLSLWGRVTERQCYWSIGL